MLGDGATSSFDVLFIASWFPAYDDIANGRFVADQVEAVTATGKVRPGVIAFDRSRLTGGAASRRRQEAAVMAASGAAIAGKDPPFVAPALGVRGDVAVARLTIPEGQTPSTLALHGAKHRETAVDALADRILADGPGEPRRGIVHAHGGYPDGAAGARLAERLGWPLVITEHSTFLDRILGVPAQRERYAAALARSHRLIAVGEMLAGELRATFPEHARQVVVIPNAVPMDQFRAPPASARVADQLLFVGYRKPKKGIEILLRAVAIARRTRPSVTLRLVGGSPDRTIEARWRALAESLGMSDGVTFEPTTDRAGIATAMAQASVFVHASPRETFGVVAAEALASGMPVVATDSGGVTEILGAEPDALGALVPVDDPEALASAIVRTLERREDFDPAVLRAAVERRFGAAFVAERLLVLYRDALAAASPGTSVQLAPARPRLPEGRLVVVALDRGRAAATLEPLPVELRAELTLLTAEQPSTVAVPAVGRVVEVDVDVAWQPAPSASPLARRGGLAGRIARLARDPLGTVRRGLGRDAGSEGSLTPATAALRQIVAAIDGPTVILPLDGHDYVAAAPVLGDDRVTPASGGLQHLGDAWHAEAHGSEARSGR